MRTLTKGILSIFISSDIFYYSNIDMKHPHIRNGIKILQANEHFVAIFKNIFFPTGRRPFSILLSMISHYVLIQYT